MTHNDLLKLADNTFENCKQILRKKNSDYSHGEDALRNFKASRLVQIEPEAGILIRLTDKLTRIGNLLHKEAAVSDEKISDTLDDMINYAFLLKAVLSDKKKK